MAKKIRFPLNMNGTDVRTLEELRDNFDLESVLGYFANGKLVTWLKDRYYDNEADAMEALSSDDSELSQKIMSILGLSNNNESEGIDFEFIKRRNEKLTLLCQFTDDKEIIDNVDSVAFNQDDLLDILDEGAEKIYLCQGEFEIPLSVKNVTYIGLDNPIVLLRAYDNVNFASLNLKFVNICFGWDISNTTPNDRLYQAERMIERQEFKNAITILEQLVAEKNPRAFNILSQMYGHVYKNAEKENLLAEQGAEIGDIFGFIDAGRNAPEAMKILHKLVSKGNPTAMSYLGYLYWVKEDFETAVKYFEAGADKGEAISCDFLLVCYRDDNRGNDKVPKHLRNNEKAIYYGKKGALLGHAAVANCMGLIYYYGEIVLKDMNEAVKYYRIAAEQGYDSAQYNLALCYADGTGVEQNYNKAVEWYRKAAEQEHSDAQNCLGVCYYNGNGVEENYNLSLYWLDRAAKNGHEKAKENAEFLRNEIQKSSKLLSDEALEEMKRNDDKLRKSLAQTGQELKSELQSITDELRADGFFNILR